MNNVNELKTNVDLYKKLRKDAMDKVKTAAQKAEQNRINQKAQQTHQP